LEEFRALLSIQRALLGMYRAVSSVYRALLGVCRALLRAYRALLDPPPPPPLFHIPVFNAARKSSRHVPEDGHTPMIKKQK